MTYETPSLCVLPTGYQLLARQFFQHSFQFLEFGAAVAVRAATDFAALGFRISFAHGGVIFV
jgi:hypothetical protein